MNAISTQAVKSLPVIFWQDQPVITTELLASVYDVQEKQIRQNFTNNTDRFVDGTHCFKLVGADLKAFKSQVENFDLPLAHKFSSSLMLWTERGTVRHAKMLGTDKAWEVQDELETFYFTHKAKAEPAKVETPKLALSTVEQRKPLNKAVRRLVAIAKDKGKHISHEEAHTLVHMQMGVQHVDELTLEQVTEAIKVVGSMLQTVILEGEYIAKGEPDTKPEPAKAFPLITNQQKQQLYDEASYATICCHHDPAAGWLINGTRAVFSVSLIDDLPAHQFDAALAHIKSKKAACVAYYEVIKELREKFYKTILSDNAPWLGTVKKEYLAEFGEKITGQVNWIDIIKQLEQTA